MIIAKNLERRLKVSEEKEEQKQKNDSDLFQRRYSNEERSELHRKGKVLTDNWWKEHGQGGSKIGPGRP